MSETPLLTSIDEMLETAQLRLAAIRFDHLSIDLKDNAPQAGIDREDSESTPIEIDCKLGLDRKEKSSEHGLNSISKPRSGRPLSRSSLIMRGLRSLFSPLKHLPTSHRKSRSWQRFPLFVKPSVT